MTQPIEPPDVIAEAARLLVRYADAAAPQRLLTVHVTDDNGRCRGCQGQVRSVPWPCALVAIARAAVRMRSYRHAERSN